MLSLESYPDILAPQDIQEILHIGRTKAYELVRNGVISGFQVGRKYLIPKASLVDFINASMYNKGANGNGCNEDRHLKGA